MNQKELNMKSEVLTNHNLLIKGRPVDDFKWHNIVEELFIPAKLAFRVTTTDSITAKKMIWSFGDGTKDQAITNRKGESIEQEVTHYFRTQNIENNETLTVVASVFTDDKIYVTPFYIIKDVQHRTTTNYVEPEVLKEQISVFYKTGYMTDELALSVNEIAKRLSYAPNFINYTYREEMVGDALIKMIKALREHKFDPEKGNPFSYFTKIAFHAFCKRIKGEKKHRQTILDYQNEVYETLIGEGIISDSDSTENNSEI